MHGGAGNEAALLNNLLTNVSNEANNNLIENLGQIPDLEADSERTENAPLNIEGIDQIPAFSVGSDDDDDDED